MEVERWKNRCRDLCLLAQRTRIQEVGSERGEERVRNPDGIKGKDKGEKSSLHRSLSRRDYHFRDELRVHQGP